MFGDPPGQRRHRHPRPAVTLQVIEDLLLNRLLILKHRTRQDTTTSAAAITQAPAAGGAGGRARRGIARRGHAAGRRARRGRPGPCQQEASQGGAVPKGAVPDEPARALSD